MADIHLENVWQIFVPENAMQKVDESPLTAENLSITFQVTNCIYQNCDELEDLVAKDMENKDM